MRSQRRNPGTARHARHAKPGRPEPPRSFGLRGLAALFALCAALLAALALLPIGFCLADPEVAASTFGSGARLVVVPASLEAFSPQMLLQGGRNLLGIKPPRQPWVPTGVDYGNTRVPMAGGAKPVCMAWQYKPKKLSAVPAGVNVLSPTWFYVEDIDGVAEVNDVAHLKKEKVSFWDPAQYVRVAHEGGAKVWATVVCIGTPDLARQVVTEEDCRNRFVSRMAGWVREYGLDGVCFDFEKMDPADKEAFTGLVAQLKQALPPGVAVAVAVTVPLKNPGGNWWQCYDREGLGKAADYLAVMAYDKMDTKPIAAIDWVRKKVKDMLVEVPAEKILLGVPFYGAEFQTDAPTGAKADAFPDDTPLKPARNIFPGQVAALLEANSFVAGKKTIEVDYWIDRGVWMDAMAITRYAFAGKDGRLHLLYCEDERSLLAKGSLTAYERLGGVAVWLMDYGTEPMWGALAEGMNAGR